jgi:hypothetical protein
MTKHIRNLQPFLTEHNEAFHVGSKDMNQPEDERYCGPIVEVSIDKNWLHIWDNASEEGVMINIETLPALRKALAILARRIKDRTIS